MKIEEIKTGDSFLVRDKSFISRCICGVMKHWAKKTGNTLLIPLIYSHAGRFVWIAGELYIFGSIENGYQPLLFRENYDLEKDDYIIMHRKLELTIAEEEQTANYCLHLDSVSIIYQYWMVIQWLAKVYLNIDLFAKDSDSTTYCYEAEMMARKNLNPDKYGQTFETDIFKLVNDPNYEIIYKSR